MYIVQKRISRISFLYLYMLHLTIHSSPRDFSLRYSRNHLPKIAWLQNLPLCLCVLRDGQWWCVRWLVLTLWGCHEIVKSEVRLGSPVVNTRGKGWIPREVTIGAIIPHCRYSRKRGVYCPMTKSNRHLIIELHVYVSKPQALSCSSMPTCCEHQRSTRRRFFNHVSYIKMKLLKYHTDMPTDTSFRRT